MKSNFSFRTLLIGLVIVIVLAMIFFRGDQLAELAETVRRGSPIPLVLAIVTQLGKYFLQSTGYKFTFAAVGERYSIRNTLPLVFGTFFMNTIAPSANLAGITLVVDDARRRGISPGKAGSAALLMQITIDSGFGVVIIVGFSLLALTVGLPIGWFLLGLFDLVVVSFMVMVLVLGNKKPDFLKRIFGRVERLVNKVLIKFKRKPPNPWAERTALSFSEASGLIAQNPKPTIKAFLCSIGASVCELLSFILVGVGFGVTNIQSLICGYVVATLFAMFSLTPQGVGFVEAAILVAFTSFGELAAAGMAIGLVYRGIVFWLPFMIGAVLIQMTSTFKGDKAPSTTNATALQPTTKDDKSSDRESSSSTEETAEDFVMGVQLKNETVENVMEGLAHLDTQRSDLFDEIAGDAKASSSKQSGSSSNHTDD